MDLPAKLFYLTRKFSQILANDPISGKNGVKYDTPLEIVNKKELIMQRVVTTKTMPQNNKTNMTPEERDAIRCWIEQGASVK